MALHGNEMQGQFPDRADPRDNFALNPGVDYILLSLKFIQFWRVSSGKKKKRIYYLCKIHRKYRTVQLRGPEDYTVISPAIYLPLLRAVEGRQNLDHFSLLLPSCPAQVQNHSILASEKGSVIPRPRRPLYKCQANY